MLEACVIALYLHPSKRRSSLHCVILNFEHITSSSSVSIVDFECLFIFWVWSNISIVFRLRWIQVSFTYRMDFHEVKYSREVVCTIPCLIFFWNLFKTSKLKCVNSIFWTPSINYAELFLQGRSPLSLVQGGQLWGGGWSSCPRLVVQGGIIHRKMSWGQRSREQLPWGKFRRGAAIV